MTRKQKIRILAIPLAFFAWQFSHWLVDPNLGYLPGEIFLQNPDQPKGEWLDLVLFMSNTYLWSGFLLWVIRGLIPRSDGFALWARRLLLAGAIGSILQAAERWAGISGVGWWDVALVHGTYLIGAIHALAWEWWERYRQRNRPMIGPRFQKK